MRIIGIVGRAYFNKDNQKIFQVNENIRKAFTNYDDIVCIEILPTNDIYYPLTKMGEDNIDVIDEKKLDYVLDKCDGFIIPGGSYFYKFDEYVVKYAIDNNKPLLAVCLGFQAICSMFSDNRSKFDMTEKLDDDSHCGPANEYVHDISIRKGTKLYDILEKDKIQVNSIHHDYINFIPKDLIVSAYSSEDNVIEAIELDNHKCFIGLEWHPEYLMDEDSIKIFNYFVENIKK
ncbi:MAG: gamma-glutamyl-gamma-aminobutyrate hydrolase family protein [Bacilli bacterium]|nr:gamma-glutamyl-gamma-aminobutyrate hydrolase family protein [Bacilli bacterium]